MRALGRLPSFLLPLVLLLWLAPLALAATDVSAAKLTLSDLPGGFRAFSAEELAEAGLQIDEPGASMAEDLAPATLQSVAYYTTGDRNDIVGFFVIGPAPAAGVAEATADLRDAEMRAELLADFTDSYGSVSLTAASRRELDVGGIGDVAAGMAVRGTTDQDAMILGVNRVPAGTETEDQVVFGLRGDYIFFVYALHAGAGGPRADIVKLARTLDRRLARAQGLSGGYRDTGLLVPEISTQIPTPLDLSTDPRVVFANLLLAALATIAMSVAMRLLNLTLATREGALEQVLRPAHWLRRAWRRLDARARSRLGGRGLGGAARLAGIVLIYVIVFSFLEPGWNPISVTGLYLLLCMTVAFGVVGIAGDIAEWRAAKRWGLPADFKARPGLVLVALSSVAATKVAGLVPGIMIGTPEAFSVDKGTVEDRQTRRLAKVGLRTIVAIGLGVWIATIATELLQRADLPGPVDALVAGLEALLLIIFAVSAENLFAELLGFPESKGELLRRTDRRLWIVALLGSTALFLQALLNPEGNMAEALGSTNVIFFLVTVGGFVAFAVGVWLYFRNAPRKAVAPAIATKPATEAVAEAPAEAADAPAEAAAAFGGDRGMVAAGAAAGFPAAVVTPGAAAGGLVAAAGMKACPVCGQSIRAAARLCRFCRTPFHLRRGGYCETCHAMVETDESFVCPTCGRPVLDPQVETFVTQSYAGAPPGGDPAAAAAAAQPQPEPAAAWAPASQGRRRRPLSTTRKLLIVLVVAIGVLIILVAGALRLGEDGEQGIAPPAGPGGGEPAAALTSTPAATPTPAPKHPKPDHNAKARLDRYLWNLFWAAEDHLPQSIPQGTSYPKAVRELRFWNEKVTTWKRHYKESARYERLCSVAGRYAKEAISYCTQTSEEKYHAWVHADYYFATSARLILGWKVSSTVKWAKENW